MLSGSLVSLGLDKNNFDLLMEIYEKALNQTFDTLMQVKSGLSKIYNYEVINNISKRIKTPESIINKM